MGPFPNATTTRKRLRSRSPPSSSAFVSSYPVTLLSSANDNRLSSFASGSRNVCGHRPLTRQRGYNNTRVLLPSCKATGTSTQTTDHPLGHRFTPPSKRQPCVLVGVELTGFSQISSADDDDENDAGITYTSERIFDMESSLSELEQLAETAGLEVVGVVTQTLSSPNPSTFIRSGKVSELRSTLQSTGSTTALFDFDLTPGQQRTLEASLSGSSTPTPNGTVISVIDRTALILDIFAQHAATREGQLQVELALYQYRLPRLTRLWTHLERQSGAGGVGLRGPGETQLEVDRRLISARVSKLKRELVLVRAHRTRLRSGRRRRVGAPVVALVGYTNAGKSTLLNALTGASSALAADALFATLDPTTRRARLPGLNMSPEVLLTDTVGFVQNLPTQLVAAFRATLEEVVDADLLLHVVDASQPRQVVRWQMQAVDAVVEEIGAAGKPTVIALNKVDAVDTTTSDELDSLKEEIGVDLQRGGNDCEVITVSAKQGTGIDHIGIVIEEALRKALLYVYVDIPYTRGDLIASIYRVGCVLGEEHHDNGTLISARVPGAMWEKLNPFMVGSQNKQIANSNDRECDDDDDGELQIVNIGEVGVANGVDKQQASQKDQPYPVDEARRWADLAKKRHSKQSNDNK